MTRVTRLLCGAWLVIGSAGCEDPIEPSPSGAHEAPVLASIILTPDGAYAAIDLGVPGETSYATAVNSVGQVVGRRTTASGDQRGFLWENGTLTDLGTLGGNVSYPFAINDAGQVIGSSATATGDEQAFLWEEGSMTLITLGGTTSIAFAINAAGQVVGTSTIAGGNAYGHAFLWENGSITDLGTLGGALSDCRILGHSGGCSIAQDINDAGQVMGYSSTPQGSIHGFLWQNGVTTDLGILGAFGSSFPFDINGVGQIVGWSTASSLDANHPFLWDGGVMTDLGTLGGDFSVAVAINDVGQIGGWSRVGGAPSVRHAVYWEGGVMTDLGTLGGGTSLVNDINERGQVVGSAQTAAGEGHAFLWQASPTAAVAVMDDLGTLGGTLSGAQAINDVGQIVGWARTEAGELHATLWRPLASEEVLQALEAEVAQLVSDGEITVTAATGLLNFLRVATAMLNDGNTDAAIRQLEAFIGAVDRLVAMGDIGEAQGASLQTSAAAAGASVGG